MKKKVEVEILYDKEYEKSFWGFDIRYETLKALQEFEKQFPIEFGITKISLWNSPWNTNSMFCSDRIFRLLEGETRDKVIDSLSAAFSLDVELDDYTFFKKRINTVWSDYSFAKIKDSPFELAYLCGKIDVAVEGLIKEIFYSNLSSISKKQKGVITIAFTGKMMSDFINSKNKGSAFVKDQSILMGLSSLSETPNYLLILHELGHLFGAKDSSGNSVMCNLEDVTTCKFDAKNRDLIVENIRNNY
jgi:hypothetical protein